MFNLRLCNAATIRYSLLKFGHMHLCGKDYKYFSPHCCKCNSFGCIAAIRCVNACHGPHSDSVYSGSEHRQFNSPRLVKREAGFPNPRRALIGSNQLWRVNDSPYYREYPSLSHFGREKQVLDGKTQPCPLVNSHVTYTFFLFVKLTFELLSVSGWPCNSKFWLTNGSHWETVKYFVAEKNHSRSRAHEPKPNAKVLPFLSNRISLILGSRLN